ncbi:hypothetical protein GQ43DRAFT_179116 [Delitschia confertaspora ATCC 74209]|uniref:Nuclear speckle splicing regulatory protein 1 N-terminal domain-containing protein n=1 Tax=Delitschia confertaspora ATCC 74209 TaxID=1513339 RepID=A0A9P4JJX6_9PLEO|nr:hypothetical protein GQ43DRAFT_179116 [Delitschia confertaspora ATCC 74209]
MSLKFGLNLQKNTPNRQKAPPPTKKKSIFDQDSEDETANGKSKLDGAEEIGEFNFDGDSAVSKDTKKQTPPSKSKGKPSGPPTLKARAKKDDPSLEYGSIQSKVAEDLDPSIYDYDAAYDAIHARNAAKRAAEQQDALERRPKYMNNLLESAEVRKRDALRAKDKLLQKERELEGDEFADKEKFVTGAYKAQQEEVKRLEEEEKKRQEEEEKKRGKLGMQGFYRKVMEDDEKRHQEAMEAVAQAAKGELKLETDEPTEKSAIDIAKELNQKGQNIVINDEGQVADKRQLLSAGLNVVAKPKIGPVAGTASRSSTLQPVHRGRDGAQRAVRERQSKMLEEQLAQATKRAADEEAEERRKLEHAAKSRKTETDISSARERYLQRKREAAAAAAKGS